MCGMCWIAEHMNAVFLHISQKLLYIVRVMSINKNQMCKSINLLTCLLIEIFDPQLTNLSICSTLWQMCNALWGEFVISFNVEYTHNACILLSWCQLVENACSLYITNGGMSSPSAQIVTTMVLFSQFSLRCWCWSWSFAALIMQSLSPPPGWNPVLSAAHMQSGSIFSLSIILWSSEYYAWLVCLLTAHPLAVSSELLQYCPNWLLWCEMNWSVQLFPTPASGKVSPSQAFKRQSTWSLSFLYYRNSLGGWEQWMEATLIVR